MNYWPMSRLIPIMESYAVTELIRFAQDLEMTDYLMSSIVNAVHRTYSMSFANIGWSLGSDGRTNLHLYARPNPNEWAALERACILYDSDGTLMVMVQSLQ